MNEYKTMNKKKRSSVADWLEREVDTKTFSDVGNFLTTSVFAGLSKDSGSIHLNTHDTKPRTTKHSLQTPYTLELNLGPFPLDVTRSFPPE